MTLTIERDGRNRDFIIVRDDSPVYCVFDSRMLDREIGYIRIDTLMSWKATDDILENLWKLDSARGIIMDLTGNPGGLLTTVLDVATLFLEKGEIISAVGQSDETKSTHRIDNQRLRQSSYGPGAGKRLPLFKQPLVIVVDGSTSGTAEILTAALKDNKRAEVVGVRTRGKGKILVWAE